MNELGLSEKKKIFRVLDEARNIIKFNSPGHNVLRYLLLTMRNTIIRSQYSVNKCQHLSNMQMDYGCIPFETMPFCSSLKGHNPSYWRLFESIDIDDRNHELLARKIQNNVESKGLLYTPISELKDLGDIYELRKKYNMNLYFKHRKKRGICIFKEYAFISNYERETLSIIESLQKYAEHGVNDYAHSVELWLKETTYIIDDQLKEKMLKEIFEESSVALIYGAAGTGKSTMINHIANYFHDQRKIFLAHTNPAINNLKRKITSKKSIFKTISSQLQNTNSENEYEVMFIDECSTVSNC